MDKKIQISAMVEFSIYSSTYGRNILKLSFIRIIMAIHFPKLKILLMSPFLKAKKHEINNMTNIDKSKKFIRSPKLISNISKP